MHTSRVARSASTVFGEAQGTHEVRVLDERAECLGAGRVVPQRREQVRLADAESAVQVDALAAFGRGRSAEPEPRCHRGRVHLRRERVQPSNRGCLGRLRRIRQVGVERLSGEARGRRELGDETVGRHIREAVDQMGHGRSLPDTMMVR